MSFDTNPDPGRTLGQFGLAVLALVLGAAALFFAIDLVSDDTPVAAGTPTPGVSAPTTTPASPSPVAPTPAPSPAATSAAPTPAPTEAEPTEAEPTEAEPTEAEPTEAEPTEAEPTEAEPTEDEPEPTEDEPTEDEPTEDEEPATDVDPSETSLQVLDAIKDGSERARDIADELEDDGYNLVAFGPSSIVYDNTTVFWTDGHEDEALALAEANGWDEVVNNDILSETVDVHVVVGLDEQE